MKGIASDHLEIERRGLQEWTRSFDEIFDRSVSDAGYGVQVKFGASVHAVRCAFDNKRSTNGRFMTGSHMTLENCRWQRTTSRPGPDAAPPPSPPRPSQAGLGEGPTGRD